MDGREARAGIGAWIAFYNTRRPPMALAGRAPLAVWREGVFGPLPGAAVEMTLRPEAEDLDDAGASPASPPSQQRQEELQAA